jgi:glycerate 2-kinase
MPPLQYADHVDHVKSIVKATLEAADPGKALSANWPYALTQTTGPCYVVGAGKAALEMAIAFDRLFEGNLAGGAVAVVPERLDNLKERPRRFDIIPASHPLPDESNVRAARAIAEVAALASQGDTLICLFSGGASAHLTLPAEGLTLNDLRKITETLLHSGAPIQALNTVRKHCERLKGGKLAQLAMPAQIWSFVLSDVIGDQMNAIASGPTASDPTTFADALAVLKRYSVTHVVPAITEHLQAGARGERSETLKSGDPALATVNNMLIGSNRRALDHARKHLKLMGLPVVGYEFNVEGEARIAGLNLGMIAQSLIDRPDRPCSWLVGGETTVTVHGEGRGGRNQEIALAAAIALKDVPNVVIVAFSTDGIDGPTDAAGAIVTGETWTRATKMGIDPEDHLNRNDSYVFFDRVGGLIRTGPTGTNVNDVAVIIAY